MASGFRVGVGVEVGVGVRVEVEVKAWGGVAIGDESGEAKFVPMQAVRMIEVIHTIPTNFSLIVIFCKSCL